jgi:hypothetical protein
MPGGPMLRPCFFNDCPCAQPAAAVSVRAASHGVWMVVQEEALGHHRLTLDPPLYSSASPTIPYDPKNRKSAGMPGGPMLRPCFFNDCPCAQPAAAVSVRAASHGVWMVVQEEALGHHRLTLDPPPTICSLRSQEPQVMLPTIPRTLSAPAPTGMPQLPHFRPCGVRAQQPFCAGAGSCTTSQRTCFEKSEEG